MVGLLLAHPAVRGARLIRLATRDAVGFYQGLGFQTNDNLPRKPWPIVEMGRYAGPEALTK